MAHDEELAARVRRAIARRAKPAERRMFGGLAFMVRGHMCCGLLGDTLMCRVGPARYAEALSKPHAREMDFTGKPMKGYVFVDREGFADESSLEQWVAACMRFNAELPEK